MFQQIRFIKWFKNGAIAWLTFSHTSRPRRVLKQQLVLVKDFIVARPALKIKLVKILNNFPQLKYRLKKLSLTQPEPAQDGLIPSSLSPRAKKIYDELLLLQQKGSK